MPLWPSFGTAITVSDRKDDAGRDTSRIEARTGTKNLAEITTSDQALQILFDAGFDHVVDYKKLSVSIMFAVFDLILVIKAQEFITCGKGCSENIICAACNWRGQFAAWAVMLRSDVAHRSASVECWPTKCLL